MVTLVYYHSPGLSLTYQYSWPFLFYALLLFVANSTGKSRLLLPYPVRFLDYFEPLLLNRIQLQYTIDLVIFALSPFYALLVLYAVLAYRIDSKLIPSQTSLPGNASATTHSRQIWWPHHPTFCGPRLLYIRYYGNHYRSILNHWRFGSNARDNWWIVPSLASFCRAWEYSIALEYSIAVPCRE
jgi:hypothetical protein